MDKQQELEEYLENTLRFKKENFPYIEDYTIPQWTKEDITFGIYKDKYSKKSEWVVSHKLRGRVFVGKLKSKKQIRKLIKQISI